MKIVECYQTSKGIFSDINEAMLKQNRVKDNDSRSMNFGEREVPKVIHCIKDDFGNYFLLNKIEVK